MKVKTSTINVTKFASWYFVVLYDGKDFISVMDADKYEAIDDIIYMAKHNRRVRKMDRMFMKVAKEVK